MSYVKITKKETIYWHAIIRVIMQLPRGTFREIRKNQKAVDILNDLEKTKFSGICSLSSRAGSGTLILKAGKCVLAEYASFKGDTALVQLLRALNDSEIDAALSTLDEAQLHLALEFNKEERVVKQGRVIPPVHKPTTPPVSHTPQKKEQVSPIPPAPAAPLPSHRERPAAQQERSQKPIRIPPPERTPAAGRSPAFAKNEAPAIRENTVPTESEDLQNTGDSGMDSLDFENLEKMTDKIRNECKTMVKDLQLDYLMEKD